MRKEPRECSLARVLVVDDEPIIRDLMLRVVRNAGYRAESSPDGEDAWNLIRNQPPDIMLLDLKMPRLDGLSLLRRIRESGINIATVVLTGQPDIESANEAVALGCYDYLLKPFNIGEIVAVLERVCLLRSLQQQRQLPDIERLIPLAKTGAVVCRRATTVLESARQMLAQMQSAGNGGPQLKHMIIELLRDMESSENALEGFVSCAEQAGSALSQPRSDTKRI